MDTPGFELEAFQSGVSFVHVEQEKKNNKKEEKNDDSYNLRGLYNLFVWGGGGGGGQYGLVVDVVDAKLLIVIFR